MIRFSNFQSPFAFVELGECVEVLDRLRKPINADARRERQGNIPYFGANGQVGWIDEWIFNEELVLVAEDGGFFEDPRRPISYIISGKTWVNNHAHVLRASSRIDVDWLNYTIAHQDVTHVLKGATLKKLNQHDLKKIRIPLPEIGEQRRIVARVKECLERVEKIESLRNQALLEAEAVLPSVLNDVFTSQFASALAQTIGDVAIETRYGTSQKCQANPVGTPILRIPNVAQGSVNFEDLKYCELSPSDLDRVRLEDGDLLFVRTNGSRDLVGRSAVFQGDGQVSSFGFASYLIRVRLDQTKVLPRYLAYFLNSTNGRAEIDSRRRTSAGQFNINSENLRSITFPVPNLPDQARLLEHLEQREAQAIQLVGELRSAMSDGVHLRESILRKAFAGEL
jgi:type I restriction enzyme S subunit